MLQLLENKVNKINREFKKNIQLLFFIPGINPGKVFPTIMREYKAVRNVPFRHVKLVLTLQLWIERDHPVTNDHHGFFKGVLKYALFTVPSLVR